MKYLLFLIIPFLLSGDEFRFIKPVAVEEAPVVTTQVKKQITTKTKVEKEKPKAVVKRKDSDGDGVIDEKDKCPNTSKDFIVDYQGCPKTASLKITFEPKSYKISSGLGEDLENFATFLKDNKGYQVVIYGYTDSLGDAEENKILSQQRADSVSRYLQTRGVLPQRILTKGVGEDHPVASNDTAQGRSQNRRVEIKLTPITQ